MLRAKVGFKSLRSIRPVTEAEQEPRLRAAALVRGIQQVGRQFPGSYRRAGSIRDRHNVVGVYQLTLASRAISADQPMLRFVCQDTPERVAMRPTRHKTRLVFPHYDIVRDGDSGDPAAMLDNVASGR
jgi:hypothetical protein